MERIRGFLRDTSRVLNEGGRIRIPPEGFQGDRELKKHRWPVRRGTERRERGRKHKI